MRNEAARQISGADALVARPSRPSDPALVRTIDFVLFLCLFLYCNSIWVWPSDAQAGQGFQRPLAALHQNACYLGLLWPLLFGRPITWISTRGQYVLFSFIFLIFASVLWSSSEGLTFKNALIVPSLVIFAQYYVGKYGSKVVAKQLVVASTVVLLSSVAAAVAHADLALMGGIHEGLWRGFFVHKNPFGAFAAFYVLLVIFAAGNLGYGLLTRGIMLALAAVVLVKSSSSTAILALASSIALVIGILTVRTMTRNAILMWLFIAVCAAPVIFAIWEYFGYLLEMVGRDTTFSGRDRVWPYFLRIIDANGFLGTGYATTYLPNSFAADAQETLFWSVRSPHNAFLGLALNLGWTGTILFALWLVLNLFSAVAAARVTTSGRLYLGFCGFSILLCLVETTGWAEVTRGDFFFLYISSVMVGRELQLGAGQITNRSPEGARR